MYLSLLLSASEHGAEAPSTNLLSPNGGLMVWTLVIFLLLWFILQKFAFKPITKAVEDREAALEAALQAAKADREAAQQLLADQRAQIEGARDEAQRIIAEGRTIGEQLRAKMLEETRVEQQEMLERARREIASERDRAIAELRKEAVDLAIAGASKVIEKNLDDQSNRQIVENFLASIPAANSASRANG
jgi:F-type H+-transporting ATPase subunit b